MSIFKSMVTAVFVFYSSSLLAVPPTIYAIEIEGLHQKDGKGEYDVIIKNALVNEKRAKLKVMPPARVEKTFETCSNCCWSPANKNPEFYQFDDSVVVSKPMGIAKIHLFTKPGSEVLNSWDQLADKKVGFRHGMPYGKTFDAGKFKKNGVKSIEKNIALLEAGRIDAFVAYVPDAYVVFEALGKLPFPHDEDHPLVEHPDALACRGVDAKTIEDFNKMLN